MKIDSIWARALLLVFVLGGLLAAVTLLRGSLAASEMPELVITFTQSVAFCMNYPADWTYRIGQGLLVFGETEGVFRGNLGPSITVFRTRNLLEPTLEERFDTYLRRGPLRGDRFHTIGAVAETTFDGRRALEVTVEGKTIRSEDAPLIRSYIVITQADNSATYVIAADAPASTWEADWPLLEAMLATTDIRE